MEDGASFYSPPFNLDTLLVEIDGLLEQGGGVPNFMDQIFLPNRVLLSALGGGVRRADPDQSVEAGR